MTDKQSFSMRALTLSGPGDLFSGKDATTRRTSSHATVLKLNSSLGGSICIGWKFSNCDVIFFWRMPRCVSGIFANLGKKLIELVGYNCQVFGISWSFFVFRRNGAINDLPKWARIVLMKSNLFKRVYSSMDMPNMEVEYLLILTL